jgi:hypothetical protein
MGRNDKVMDKRQRE